MRERHLRPGGSPKPYSPHHFFPFINNIFFNVRRKKKKKDSATAPGPLQQMIPPPPPLPPRPRPVRVLIGAGGGAPARSPRAPLPVLLRLLALGCPPPAALALPAPPFPPPELVYLVQRPQEELPHEVHLHHAEVRHVNARLLLAEIVDEDLHAVLSLAEPQDADLLQQALHLVRFTPEIPPRPAQQELSHLHVVLREPVAPARPRKPGDHLPRKLSRPGVGGGGVRVRSGMGWCAGAGGAWGGGRARERERDREAEAGGRRPHGAPLSRRATELSPFIPAFPLQDPPEVVRGHPVGGQDPTESPLVQDERQPQRHRRG